MRTALLKNVGKQRQRRIKMRRTVILLCIAVFSIFIGVFLFSGCASKSITVEESEVRSGDRQTVHLSEKKTGKTEKPKEDFIIGFNPFKDDPDNPSPHNPLIKKFGDIPQVRTFIRLQRKYLSGTPLTIDEAIDLFTADLYLYPQQKTTKGRLKYLKKRKKELEASGKENEFEWKYTGTTSYNFTRSNGRKTIIHPDGSKTIYDSRVEGGVIEVPSQAESPYIDDANNEKP